MAIKTNESAKRLNESLGIYEITDMLPKKEKMYVNDMAFSAEGQPYFLLDNGNIYRMRLDDTGFTQELVWEAPRLYTNFIPARITGNTILIEATASWEEIPLRVFMSVDLANGTITDSYTFGEEEATGYRCRSCAALTGDGSFPD